LAEELLQPVVSHFMTVLGDMSSGSPTEETKDFVELALSFLSVQLCPFCPSSPGAVFSFFPFIFFPKSYLC